MPRSCGILASPLVALLLLLLVVSITIHMRLGMQVVIEDYIHGPVLGRSSSSSIRSSRSRSRAISVFAILKLAFGG